MARHGRRNLPKHCSAARDRHGKLRLRFRKGGFTTYLHGAPWSDEFMAAYAAAMAGVVAAKGEAGAGRTRPGSISALLVRYYRSPEYMGVKATTQKTYRSVLERFRAEHGDRLARDMKREHAKAIIGRMSATPAAANATKRLMAMVYDFGLDIGMVTVNPWRGLKGYRTASEGIHPWSEAEIEQFERAHPVDSKARLALALLVNTGARRGDVVRLGWQHLRAGRLCYTQEKTGAVLEIPVHPDLLAILNVHARGNLTFLTTQYGAPYSPDGLGNAMRKWCDAAGLPECSAHGLRKAIARRLAEAGCTIKEIAAITGHKSLREVERYSASADQVRLADAAAAAMLTSTNIEQKLSNPPLRLDKAEAK